MIAVTLHFRLRRPNDHFVGGKRCQLKDSAPRGFCVGRSDIDNLSKFVLDCLNGLLFMDDRRVVSLTAMKVWDSHGTCEGSTTVELLVASNNG